MKHLARKATDVLLCHGSNNFAIVVACNTCVSENYSGVSQLLRDTMSVCVANNINVQLINSDGANYKAVKEVAQEYRISGVSCACHLPKNIRNFMMEDKKQNRILLVPVHKVHILSNQSQYNSICKQTGVNFVTVDISGIISETVFQISHGGSNSKKVIFQCLLSNEGYVPYFDESYQYAFKTVSDKSGVSLSFYSLDHSFDILTFRCSKPDQVTIQSTGLIVQKVSMDTVRKTYEGDIQVQRLINWEAMHCSDKMKESLMADLCSDEYLKLLEERYSEFPGLYKYLKMMNCVYHPPAQDKSIENVITNYTTALEIANDIRDLTKNFSGPYGLSMETYAALELNVEGIRSLYSYLQGHKKDNGELLTFKTRLLLTNRLEGLFGRARQIMRRFTAYQFQFILTKLVTECLYFLHPERKHTMTLGKRSHYIDYLTERSPDVDQSVKQLLELYTKRSIGQKSYSFTQEEGTQAMELAWAFHMPKVKIIRDSYYGAKYNDVGMLHMMRHKK